MQAPPPPAPEAPKPEETSWTMNATTIQLVIAGLFYFLHALGAAKLAYEHYSSVLLALIAFLFAPFFYMFYAFVVGGKIAPPPLIMGGRRRR